MQICQGGNHSTFKWFFHLFWELFFAFLGTIFHFLGTIFCFFGNYFSFFGNYFPFLMVRDFVYHFSGSLVDLCLVEISKANGRVQTV